MLCRMPFRVVWCDGDGGGVNASTRYEHGYYGLLISGGVFNMCAPRPKCNRLSRDCYCCAIAITRCRRRVLFGKCALYFHNTFRSVRYPLLSHFRALSSRALAIIYVMSRKHNACPTRDRHRWLHASRQKPGPGLTDSRWSWILAAVLAIVASRLIAYQRVYARKRVHAELYHISNRTRNHTHQIKLTVNTNTHIRNSNPMSTNTEAMLVQQQPTDWPDEDVTNQTDVWNPPIDMVFNDGHRLSIAVYRYTHIG